MRNYFKAVIADKSVACKAVVKMIFPVVYNVVVGSCNNCYGFGRNFERTAFANDVIVLTDVGGAVGGDHVKAEHVDFRADVCYIRTGRHYKFVPEHCGLTRNRVILVYIFITVVYMRTVCRPHIYNARRNLDSTRIDHKSIVVGNFVSVRRKRLKHHQVLGFIHVGKRRRERDFQPLALRYRRFVGHRVAVFGKLCAVVFVRAVGGRNYDRALFDGELAYILGNCIVSGNVYAVAV